MQQTDTHDDAVSEVVGEMLMLTMVLILFAVFAATLGNFLPADRDPSVTVLMSHNDTTLSLWHKGGDWVEKTDMTITIENETAIRRFSDDELTLDPATQVFDLGSSLTVPVNITGDEEVRIIAGRSVIFSGEVE